MLSNDKLIKLGLESRQKELDLQIQETMVDLAGFYYLGNEERYNKLKDLISEQNQISIKLTQLEAE